MFKVMVQGKTKEELTAALMAFVVMLEPERTVQAEPQITETADPNAKRGRGRPKKDEKGDEATPLTNPPQEVPSQALDPFAEQSETTPKTYTFEQVKAALKEVSKMRTGDPDPSAGISRVMTILGKFGYKGVKEIEEKNYPAVMKECGLDK